MCDGWTDFTCAGFMYKVNGTHNSDEPGSWLDQACTLLKFLEPVETSVTSLNSAVLL